MLIQIIVKDNARARARASDVISANSGILNNIKLYVTRKLTPLELHNDVKLVLWIELFTIGGGLSAGLYCICTRICTFYAVSL